jgi:beta-lactamase superfamily II metal-dependent hydrolase
MSKSEEWFAAYPSAVIYSAPKNDTKKPSDGSDGVDNGEKPKITAKKQLLWGDFVRLTGKEDETKKWVEVDSRGVKGWVKKTELQKKRILEVIFIDIGQGDSCLIVTPQDKHIIIDAGAADNLLRFLNWRYGSFKKKFKFESIVISHSDADHYAGFDGVFENPNIEIGTIYHNGIVERAGKNAFGPKKDGYLTDVIQDKTAMEKLLSNPANKTKKYPTMLKKALDSGRVKDVKMLCSLDKYMPEYEPDKELVIEVAGPVPDKDAGGKLLMKWFGDVGKTKNGHSVVLRLKYGSVKILLGGDLNTPSEEHLLSKHTGMSVPPKQKDEEKFLKKAQKVFQSDIAKSCHHGSADFTDLFLRAVNPIATVISSGDDEPHAHPRSDTLGAIGKFGRGERPAIFSTELSRSAKEAIKKPSEERQKFKDAVAKLEAAKTDAAKAKAREKINKLVNETIKRSVDVFGAINVRTDGSKVVIAYKIERDTRKDKQWDIYELKTVNGELSLIPKHGKKQIAET